MLIELTGDEFDRIKIALDWYSDDRRECAKIEAAGLYDAGSEESTAAAVEAEALLAKLRTFPQAHVVALSKLVNCLANLTPYTWDEDESWTDDQAEDAIVVLNRMIEDAGKVAEVVR